jgi:TonB-dependent starch-binding outer membrane protein SusC
VQERFIFDMRAIPLAALLCLVTSPAVAQSAGDSAVNSNLDRYVIDAATLVRQGGVYSLADLLISQVPGLFVVPGSGLTGVGTRIRFAGPRALASDGAPLILVDGIRVDAAEDAALTIGIGPSRLDDLSPDDIESIEVLRGPASGAIYGGGAATGVILIRTKGGTSGPVRWDGYAQGALGFEPSRWPTNYGGVDLDNANAWARQGGCTLTEQAAGRCVQDFVQSFNPLRDRSPFTTAFRRQIGFSGSGGPQWGAFRISGKLDSDDGAYSVPGNGPPDVDRRWNVQASGTARPLTHLQVTGSLAHVSGDTRLPMLGPLRALTWPSDSTGFTWSPLFDNAGKQTLERSSGFLEVRGTPLPALSIRGLLGLDDVDQLDVSQQGHDWSDGRRKVRHNTSVLGASLRGPTGPRLRFETTLGLERRTQRLDELQRQWIDTGTICALPNPCLTQGVVLRLRAWSAYMTEQVALRDKLFINAALRRDRFEEFRWTSWQPSIAVAWFVRSRLKLRAAYGSVGAPPDFPILAFFTYGPPPAPPLRPDRTRSFEVGGDAGLFGGRWTGRLTFYDMHSNVTYPTPLFSPSACCAYGYVPGAEISNRGVEATFSGALLDRPTLRWDVRVSVWGNRNRLLRLPGPPVLLGSGGLGASWQMLRPGYPTAGYWTAPIQSFADANGDGIIDQSEVVVSNTRVPAGTPYPTQGLVLTSKLNVARRWHLSTTLDYRAGQTLFNEVAWERCLAAVCLERNDPGTPLAAQATAVATSVSASGYIEDADYLKVRELAVAFDVSPAATIALTGRNLFTWTGYSGGDPETGSYGFLVPGHPRTIQDYGLVPLLRSWTLRVQLAY